MPGRRVRPSMAAKPEWTIPQSDYMARRQQPKCRRHTPHRHQEVPDLSGQEDRRRPYPPSPVPPHLRHPPDGPRRADGAYHGFRWLEEFGDGQALRESESGSPTATCGSIRRAAWVIPQTTQNQSLRSLEDLAIIHEHGAHLPVFKQEQTK